MQTADLDEDVKREVEMRVKLADLQSLDRQNMILERQIVGKITDPSYPQNVKKLNVQADKAQMFAQ